MFRIASKCLTGRRVLAALLLVAAPLVFAGAAQARTETIEWSQANMANVVGWKIHIGSVSRVYTTVIDTAMPTPDANGVYRFDIEVPGEDPAFVAMTSYNSELVQSALSNERVKGPADPPPSSLSAPYWVP